MLPKLTIVSGVHEQVVVMKRTIRFVSSSFAILLSMVQVSSAQELAGEQLIDALREGGYVIVMRHASSPRALPDEATANPDNINRERQLDETGRTQAAAMGEAVRSRGIRITEVLSSPTYRAIETARRMGYSEIRPVDELSNEGMRASGEEYTAWLRANVAVRPDADNRLLITHGPNVSAAFPEYAADMGEGEALVFRPGAAGDPAMVARLAITDWPNL
jgi:phosphohistidine phosphatase SixA